MKRSDVLSVLLPISLLVRYAISLHGYSGEGNADGRMREDGTPMYGDYEAQRHWMELTLHLPAKDWYRQTTDNDLLYWGLDYPPLTAWHSRVCGYIMNAVEPAAVALGSSRGYESSSSRMAMRLLVMGWDLLVFYTGVLAAAGALDPHPTVELLALHGALYKSAANVPPFPSRPHPSPLRYFCTHVCFLASSLCLGVGMHSNGKSCANHQVLSGFAEGASCLAHHYNTACRIKRLSLEPHPSGCDRHSHPVPGDGHHRPRPLPVQLRLPRPCRMGGSAPCARAATSRNEAAGAWG
jgi:hypothetical protein